MYSSYNLGYNFAGSTYARLKRINVAKLLWSLGYRQISRRFCMISRVDVPLEKMNSVLRQNQVTPTGHWTDADYYRRCLSKDMYYDVPGHIMIEIRRLGQ